MDTGYLHILAIVNYAAKNMGIHIFLWDTDFIYSWYMPRGKTAGSYGILFLIFEEMPYCFP